MVADYSKPSSRMHLPIPVLITGGCGFIGSAVVRRLVAASGYSVFNLDKLTYAGSEANVSSVSDSDRYKFISGDVADRATVRGALQAARPEYVIHLAAETHVDRSIDGPADFIETNVVGTYTLLEESLAYWNELPPAHKSRFRVLHVSTDEVFGSLGPSGRFTEDSPYQPRSPYAASKAASDHLVRAWHHTFGLPILVTNCSNNYGPYQYPEKLVPLTILNALEYRPIPVYGNGQNVRDWLHVEDHADALLRVLENGTPGETYNIGSDNQRTNIELVRSICDLVDRYAGCLDARSRQELVHFVDDRPGHDFRYAIDASKLGRCAGWRPAIPFAAGLERTVRWYIDNQAWCTEVTRDTYGRERLGLTGTK